MNKCVVFSIVCAFSICAFAHNGDFFDSAARNRVKAIESDSQAVLDVKNFWLAQKDHSWFRGFSNVLNMGYSAEELHEIDIAFSQIGAVYKNNLLPCCFTNAVNKSFSKDERRREICFKYGTIGEILNSASLEDELYLFNCVWKNTLGIRSLKIWQTEMTKVYVRELKKYLRQTGVGFVTKDGKNPCEPYVNRFLAALNAPKMDGINGCFAEINQSNVTFDFSQFMSDADIESLKEKLLNGEVSKQSLALVQMRLLVALGVDGYNQLVRQYNGN